MRNLSGWKADAPDGRDYIKAFGFKTSPKPPKKIDLRASMQPVPVSNQDELGSCVAQAWCDTLEYLSVKSGQSHVDLSRLFVYYCARELDGNVQWDAVSTIRSGAKVLAKIGAPVESLWPYNISEFKTRPSEQAYANAPNQKLSRYERIPNLFSIKSVLAHGIPVVFGFAVYQSFEQAASGGHVPYPVLTGSNREGLLGGHAVVAVGYDNTKPYSGALSGRGCVICRNSWGPQWGDGGYFYLPYPFFRRGLTADHWTAAQGTFT